MPSELPVRATALFCFVRACDTELYNLPRASDEAYALQPQEPTLECERSLRMHGRLLLSVVGTAALLVGCSQSDSGITSSVKSKLIADDIVKARDITVDTHDRVVTLTGTVESATEESRAIELARNTNGVADVVDKMSVASAEP